MIEKKKLNKFLFVFALILIFFALVNIGVTFYKMGGTPLLTGYATGIGTANLSIVSQASITFPTNIINWGIGRVNETAIYAVLNSEGTVTDGNWSVVDQGLTVRNDGNCNVQLNLTTSNTAAGFIGGSSPVYQIKVTANESSSCTTGLADAYATATGVSQAGCDNFTYYDAQDTLDIDVQLNVPQDALKGAKGSVITATATVID
jgi:hypothetical protein